MIAIVQGCGTNVSSILFALERLGKKALLTHDAKVIQAADHVILPGVGTAKQAMLQLDKFRLTDVIRGLKQPVLGICLGMQILFEFSSEGDSPCLGIIPGRVACIPENKGLTIPHMGWNQLLIKRDDSSLLQGINANSYVYFVHSYAAPVNDNTIAFACYGNPFSAIVKQSHFYGMQFHPERSGAVGEKLLSNFLEIK